MKLYYNKEEKMFKGHCADISLPVAFEYNPRANSANMDEAKLFRRAFARAFNPSTGKTSGPTVLVVRGSQDDSVEGKMAEMVESMCASLGTIPVVLKVAELKDGDTFWLRVATAAMSMALGSLPVVAVDKAHKAGRDELAAAVAASKEHRVALCILAPLGSMLAAQIPQCMEITLCDDARAKSDDKS